MLLPYIFFSFFLFSFFSFFLLFFSSLFCRLLQTAARGESPLCPPFGTPLRPKNQRDSSNSDERCPDGITLVPLEKRQVPHLGRHSGGYIRTNIFSIFRQRKCWRSTNEKITATLSSTIHSALLPWKLWGRSMERV